MKVFLFEKDLRKEKKVHFRAHRIRVFRYSSLRKDPDTSKVCAIV